MQVPESPLALLLGPQPFELCLRWLNDICRISPLNRVAFHRMAGPRLLWSMLMKATPYYLTVQLLEAVPLPYSLLPNAESRIPNPEREP